MSALIPAIINFVISRRRKGGGGGGYGGGRPEKSPEEMMRNWMAQSFIKEMDNVASAVNANTPDGVRSYVPQIMNNLNNQPQFPQVMPGFFQNPAKSPRE